MQGTDSDLSDTGADTDTDTELDTDTDSESDVDWSEADLVLPAVTVVDADGARGPVWVVVDNDRIVGVLDSAPDVREAIVVESARGKFVTPGLVDPHVHLFLSGAAVSDPAWTLADNLRANLYFGVTSVVDAGSPQAAFTLRSASESVTWRGPSVRTLGQFITVPGGHPCELAPGPACFFPDSEQAVRSFVATQAAFGLDGVKVAFTDASHSPWATDRLPDAFAEVAFATDLPLRYVHADSEAEALRALELGADHLAHPPFAEGVSASGAARIADQAGSVHTTLGAFSGPGDVLADRVPWDTLAPVVPAGVLADWQAVRDAPDLLVAGYADEAARWHASARSSLRELRVAGAPVVPASDAGYLFVAHGEGLHRELAAMVELGWSPQDALTAATRDAAFAAGFDDRGLVAEGLRADLLVLDADPLNDLATLSAPVRVVVGGRSWTRAQLRSEWQPFVGGNTTALCLGDCPDGQTCQRASQTCQPDVCDVAGQLDSPCGPRRACDVDLTCADLQTCDPLDPAGTCSPEIYGQNCVPFDLDSFGCAPSGERLEGELCDVRFASTSCARGMFCSTFDSRCYRFCDPAGGEPACADTQDCVVQEVGGEAWFSVCLSR